MRKINLREINPIWWRLASFLGILFFILLSDAVLSDWVPGHIQEMLGSPVKMGLVLSFSSIVGFGVDLIFPQLLRGASVKKLAIGAVIGSGVFILTLFYSSISPYLLVILMGMAAWGVYYEFDSFMTQQFVSEQAPPHYRSAMWAIVEVVRAMAYFAGPLIGSYLAVGGDRVVLSAAGSMLAVGYLLLLFFRFPAHVEESPLEHINLAAEIAHWVALAKHVWPVLILTFVIGLVDSAFWTTGTVVNDMLATQKAAGGWFLSLYMLPSLFVGFVVAKWGIYQGKKKWAERFLLVAGIILSLITVVNSLWWILGIVFFASMFLWAAIPLVDAVYTDIVTRMGRERKHMFGLSSSMFSLAYVVGPIMSGWLVTKAGEIGSFVIWGMLVIVIAIFLLLVTPRKLRLPQNEIAHWE